MVTFDWETSDDTKAILNLRNSSWASKIYFRNDWSVWIWTTSPWAKLDINSSSTTDKWLLVYNNTAFTWNRLAMFQMDSSSATWNVTQIYNNWSWTWLLIDQNWNWVALNIDKTASTPANDWTNNDSIQINNNANRLNWETIALSWANWVELNIWTSSWAWFLFIHWFNDYPAATFTFAKANRGWIGVVSRLASMPWYATACELEIEHLSAMRIRVRKNTADYDGNYKVWIMYVWE